MALIKCPECGKEISEYARYCLGCGCPSRYFPKSEGTRCFDAQSRDKDISTLADNDIEKGSVVMFGSWGGEDIEWRVLDRKRNRILLITKEAIDCLPMHNSEYVQGDFWKNCTLKQWLEETFEKSAFTEEEKKRLMGHPFLLSKEEAREHFRNDLDRVCQPTVLAEINGVFSDEKGACRWWLRSQYNSERAAYISSDGRVVFDKYGMNRITTADNGVRPALWVDL